jgi:hypothetical protein
VRLTVDSFDVVAVGIEKVGRIDPGHELLVARSRRTVVAIASVNAGAVERIDLRGRGTLCG